MPIVWLPWSPVFELALKGGEDYRSKIGKACVQINSIVNTSLPPPSPFFPFPYLCSCSPNTNNDPRVCRRNSHASTTRFARQRSLRQGSLRHAYSSQPHSLDGVGGASSDYRTGVPGPQSNERSTLTGDGGGAASTSSPAVAEAGCGAVSERRPDYRPDTTTHQAAETEHTPASQAQTYIESELQSCQCMDYGRREILLSALAFASQASSQTATLRDPEPCTLDDANFDSENMFPSAQTLHFILNGNFFSPFIALPLLLPFPFLQHTPPLSLFLACSNIIIT